MKKRLLIISIIAALLVISIVILITIKERVNIAVIGNYSGGETSYDQLGYNGIELAAKDINEVQDDTLYRLYQIDMSIFDTEDKLDEEIKRVKADMIFGPFLSSSLVQVADYLKSQDIPVFVISATHDSVSGGDDSVFRLMNSTSNQAHQTAELIETL